MRTSCFIFTLKFKNYMMKPHHKMIKIITKVLKIHKVPMRLRLCLTKSHRSLKRLRSGKVPL